MDGKMNFASSDGLGLGAAQNLVKAQAGNIDSVFFLGTMPFAQISQAADNGLGKDDTLYTQYSAAYTGAQ
jgi:hypothetical protein